MSVRYLYRKVPVSRRTCSYYACQGPILRNIIQTEDGRIWHYGCLQTAKDQRFHCFDCFADLDGTEVDKLDLDGQENFVCRLCGGTNLRTPEDRRQEWLAKQLVV